MAEAANKDNNDGGAAANYEVSAKALEGTDAILNADKDDEALRKYKESLGIGKDPIIIDENNPNCVIPLKLTMKFFDGDGDNWVKDIEIDLKEPPKLVQVQQGLYMDLNLTFQVQRDMVTNVGMKMKGKTKMGFTGFNYKHVIGSYPGHSDEIRNWKAPTMDLIPSGMAARTTLTTQLVFTAREMVDGKVEEVEFCKKTFKLKIAKTFD